MFNRGDCRLVPDDCDVTTALSLAENITQAPMNAIDEFEALPPEVPMP